MTTIRILAAFVLAVLLTACGGGEGAIAVAPPVVVVTPQLPTPVLPLPTTTAFLVEPVNQGAVDNAIRGQADVLALAFHFVRQPAKPIKEIEFQGVSGFLPSFLDYRPGLSPQFMRNSTEFTASTGVAWYVAYTGNYTLKVVFPNGYMPPSPSDFYQLLFNIDTSAPLGQLNLAVSSITYIDDTALSGVGQMGEAISVGAPAGLNLPVVRTSASDRWDTPVGMIVDRYFSYECPVGNVRSTCDFSAVAAEVYGSAPPELVLGPSVIPMLKDPSTQLYVARISLSVATGATVTMAIRTRSQGSSTFVRLHSIESVIGKLVNPATPNSCGTIAPPSGCKG